MLQALSLDGCDNEFVQAVVQREKKKSQRSSTSCHLMTRETMSDSMMENGRTEIAATFLDTSLLP